MCARVFVGQKRASGVIPLIHLLFFETESPCLWLHLEEAKLAGQSPRDSPVSASPAPGF